ncbi:MAG: PilZ domain-containing protein [Deltaproteobacteria bacterium]|nr:PilZ domain-containing protein [Deltaproteobacteria bacterium]
MASESERRGDVRAPIELKIEYKSLNTFFADYTANLSTRGTFIRTPNPLPVGTEFNFKLVVPRMDNAIELRGVVRWIRGKDQGTQESKG